MTGLPPALSPYPLLPAPDDDVAIESTVRLDRNLASYPFPWRASAEEARAAAGELAEAAACAGLTLSAAASLGQAGRDAAAERGVASRAYLMDDGRLLAFDPGRRAWLRFNDGAHCAISCACAGLDLETPWSAASSIDDRLASSVAWAFDPEAGYVQADALRCGSGLAAWVRLHLPGLSMAGLLDGVFRKALEAGFIIEGAYSARQTSAGSAYSLALPEAYREAEAASLERLQRSAALIAEYERRARAELAERRALELGDLVGRAYGVAREALLLGRDEADELVSALRLGLSCGLLTGLGMAETAELWLSLRMARGSRPDGASEAGAGPHVEAGPSSEGGDAAERARLLRDAAARLKPAKG